MLGRRSSFEGPLMMATPFLEPIRRETFLLIAKTGRTVDHQQVTNVRFGLVSRVSERSSGERTRTSTGILPLDLKPSRKQPFNPLFKVEMQHAILSNCRPLHLFSKLSGVLHLQEAKAVMVESQTSSSAISGLMPQNSAETLAVSLLVVNW